MLVDVDGRPFDPALLTRGNDRSDSWQNGWTGIGTSADKTTAGRYFPPFRVMDQELRSLRDGSAIAARMVEDAPNELFREGYELTGRIRKDKKSGTPTDAATDVLESDANDMREWAEEEFGIDEQTHAAMTEGRYWGGCLELMGINDGGYPWDPVNEDRIESLDYVSLIDRRYAYVQSQYSGMLAKNAGRYGSAEIYLISNAIASSGWNGYGSITRTPSKKLEGSGAMTSFVHESRVLRFDGNPADVQSRQRLAGWSWSILQRVYNDLRSFAQAFDSAMYLLSDASQGVLKIMGLFASISGKQSQAIQDRALLFDQQRSVMRSIILDAGDKKGNGAESFERAPTTFTGVPELLDRVMMLFSAATPEREPVSLLFGRAAGTLNATGDSEIRTWYDSVRAMGNKRVAPRLRRFYRIAGLAKNSPMKGKRVDWTVTFKPLWSPSDKEKAEADLARAQRDQILVEGCGIPEEVVALTWKDEYPALPVKEIEKALKAKVSYDPHENDEDETDVPETAAGAGEPLGQGAPIPTLGPSVSPEAGGAKAQAAAPAKDPKDPASTPDKPAPPKKPGAKKAPPKA